MQEENRQPYQFFNISEWLDFDFYDLVWCKDNPDSNESATLGRWLGVAHQQGTSLCYYVLKQNGQILSRTSVQHVTQEDLQSDAIRQQVTDFNTEIERRMCLPNQAQQARPNVFFDPSLVTDDIRFEEEGNILIDEDGYELIEPCSVDEDLLHDQQDSTPVINDEYVGAEIQLPRGDQFVYGRVAKRARTDDGQPVGTSNCNPLLDTREYIVEMSDGTELKYLANTIAENMLSQVDSEGRHYRLLKEISDYTCNTR